MKATGIVRRIDDPGRVVIPKEIRRTMRIREGYPPWKFLPTARARSFSRSIRPSASWRLLQGSMQRRCTRSAV